MNVDSVKNEIVKAEPVRLTLNVTQAESATVSRLADQHGKTKTTVIRDGIHLADWVDKIRGRKAAIFVKEPDGTLREVELRW